MTFLGTVFPNQVGLDSVPEGGRVTKYFSNSFFAFLLHYGGQIMFVASPSALVTRRFRTLSAHD